MRLSKLAAAAVVAATAVGGLGGCNNNMKDQNARLMEENRGLRDENGQLSEALDAAERDRGELANELSRARMEASRAAAPTRTGGNTGFEGINGVTGERGVGEVTAVVEGDLMFDSGRIDLKSGAKTSLDKVASVLNSTYSGKSIRIEGHTDIDPIKKSQWKTNDRLSCERAMAVKAYLESKGIDSKRMYVAGLADTQPRTSKKDSRRVEIVVVVE